MKKENINISALADKEGCFDLQFRKDVRKERLNSPTYYRFKAQFVITNTKDVLEKIKKHFGCGNIHLIKNQARYSVQNVGELKDVIIPYFTAAPLTGKKKSDFDLWSQGVEIIHKNKGKVFSSWEKADFQRLIDIQKASVKFKDKPRDSKWIDWAQDLVKTL